MYDSGCYNNIPRALLDNDDTEMWESAQWHTTQRITTINTVTNDDVPSPKTTE